MLNRLYPCIIHFYNNIVKQTLKKKYNFIITFSFIVPNKLQVINN